MQTLHCEPCKIKMKGKSHHCPMVWGQTFPSIQGKMEAKRIETNWKKSRPKPTWATVKYIQHRGQAAALPTAVALTASLLTWLCSFLAVSLSRHYTFLGFPVSCSLYYSFGFTLTASHTHILF